MSNFKIVKGVCCALMLSSPMAMAEWKDVPTDSRVTHTSAVFDNVKRVIYTVARVENTGSQTLNGPFRVVIDKSTLAVANSDGVTEDGLPYFDVALSELEPGETQKFRIDFELARKPLLLRASLQSEVAEDGWQLVWSDEFEGTEIDESKWSHEVNCDGGGNNEKQCYTDSADNSYIENGVLNIVAKAESGQSLPYSSARLRTVDKGDWTYGRFEIRAKAPSGQGAWPAIWMLPTDYVYGGWPHSGEIDIFEAVNLGVPLDDGTGSVESAVHGTLHYGQSWPNNDYSGLDYALPDEANPADDFHVYAIEWEEGEIRWYVDGVLYQTQLKSEVSYNENGVADGLEHRGWYTEQDGEFAYTEAPFDERFHMILNFAVGGDWPENVNQGGVDPSAFDGTNKFQVDYVRVYECSVNPTNGQGCATVTEGYLDPIDEGGTLNEGQAPIPIPPSDGIAEDLIIFEETLNPAWPAWDCCGGTTPTIEYEDGDYLNVVEFVVGAEPTVLGFNTNFAETPEPYDGSPLEDTGVLEFDLKLVTPPNNASAGWNLKVEQGGAATEANIVITAPTSQWQHYSVPLKTLSNAGLELNGIDVLMIFPDWGAGEGAVYRVDNVTITETQDDGGDDGSLSDVTPIDFEEGGYGAGVNWNVFENDDNPALEFVDNPDTSGINDSSTVAKFTARVTGAPWVGTETVHGEFGPLTLDETNSIVKMMVYKSVISDVGVKFAINSGGAQQEIKVANTLINEWEELTFDFSGYIGLAEAIDIDQVIVFPDFDNAGRTQENIVYFDNIRFYGQGSDDDGGDDDSGGDDGGDDGSQDGDLVSNGSFDNGGEDWIGAVNVIEEDGNKVFYANVLAAGNAWDVNLSQVMTLLADETYIVSFKAKASVERTILVGLGLNYDPWTNVAETASLTTDWVSYSFTITTTGFGGENNRVLFDLGAEVGEVYIDDVSVVLQDSNGGEPIDGDTYTLISSTGDSDINFESDTVGEWSTGTSIQSDVMFDGLLGWELVSSSNSPEQGNWGTVLAFQNGINGDLSLFNRIELKLATTGNYASGYKIAISGNGVSKEITLPIDESIDTWQTVTLDTSDIPLNLSTVDWIAVYGIGGQSGVSTIYITDFSFIQDETIPFDSTTNDDFVFISSDESVPSDLIVDGDNNSDVGNVIFGEWSTGTLISDANYAGLDGIKLSANGSWGAVLALQGDISDGSTIDNYDVDFAEYTNIKFKVASEGAFERYALAIVSNVNGNQVSQEVGFSLASQAEWNLIDIDLAMYGVNLSNVSQVALFGVYQGGSASQDIYVTDLIMYDSGKLKSEKDSSDDKFVFFSSTGEETDMIIDDNNFANDGNITLNEWSTGTTFMSDVIYNGLTSFELSKGSGWGAVLALMGDIYGDVQQYDIDVSKYTSLNFKIASTGSFSEYTLDFIVDGVEFKVPLSVNSSWSDVSIDLSEIPLDLSKLTQIAIFGVGGNTADKIYLTDYHIAK
ncbi:family 16 glycosylhydrolase [Paraglaciecola marina]|uniref:family 16 glycosylhydrolase n=1 Tax=Paraglaciecola marina TaxID=2500157 RepID=UPI00105F0B81|nr:family 16 glycosylhydrolase [Paraglaciecola marina]